MERALRFPVWVRAVREALGETQVEFGIRVGASYSAVWHWEKGRRYPRTALQRALLRAGEAAGMRPWVDE